MGLARAPVARPPGQHEIEPGPFLPRSQGQGDRERVRARLLHVATGRIERRYTGELGWDASVSMMLAKKRLPDDA